MNQKQTPKNRVHKATKVQIFLKGQEQGVETNQRHLVQTLTNLASSGKIFKLTSPSGDRLSVLGRGRVYIEEHGKDKRKSRKGEQRYLKVCSGLCTGNISMGMAAELQKTELRGKTGCTVWGK